MTDPNLLTLHTLTLRQLANAEQIAAITGLSAEEAATGLEKAAADGHAMGAKDSYMITPAGRTHLDEAYPSWFAAERDSSAVEAAMDKFEEGVNRQVLSLTTDWQTVDVDGEQQPNDHGDAEYDARIIDGLAKAQHRVESALAPLIDLQPTVTRFIDRLGASLTRAESGESDYVSGVRVDSFHTVWFQMHEHILRITGRERPE